VSNLLNDISNAIQTFESGWVIFGFLFPAAAAATTAWLARRSKEPWHLVLFYSAGAFAFAAVSITNLSTWTRENTIFGKLKPDSFMAMVVKVAGSKDELAANCSMELQNKSMRDVFYQLEEAELSLNGRTAAGNTIDRSILMIQAQSSVRISFATIRDIKAEPMTGRLKLKIRYGGDKDALSYQFELEAEPQVSPALNDKGEPLAVMATFAIKDMKNF